MDISKFNIVTYIKPNHDFDIFSRSLARIQKSKHLDKIYISFVKELSNEFKNELNRYDNIIWKDGVDEYWASEMKRLIDTSTSSYYYIWEEDSDIYDIEEFDSSYEYLISKGIDFLVTQDLKWIKRAEHLLENNLAIKDGKFIYFNWGTQYAKFCRESTPDRLINCAYPVTVNGIFSKNLIVSLLDYLIKSEYWEKITKGDFNHYHHNPKLPHSFEVFPGFWWEGINDGYGNVEYITTVSTKQYGRELGDRLVNKINGK